MVRGDVLIDDAPQAKGLSSGLTPEWTHVYFAAPYNAPERYPQGAHRRRLETWADWPKVLDALCPLVSKPRAPVTRSESKQLL